jgi:hypothetical protein
VVLEDSYLPSSQPHKSLINSARNCRELLMRHLNMAKSAGKLDSKSVAMNQMCRINNEGNVDFVIGPVRTSMPVQVSFKFFRKQRVDTACMPIQ